MITSQIKSVNFLFFKIFNLGKGEIMKIKIGGKKPSAHYEPATLVDGSPISGKAKNVVVDFDYRTGKVIDAQLYSGQNPQRIDHGYARVVLSTEAAQLLASQYKLSVDQLLYYLQQSREVDIGIK